MGEGRVFKIESAVFWKCASPRSAATTLSHNQSLHWLRDTLKTQGLSHLPEAGPCQEVRTSATPPLPGPATMDLSPEGQSSLSSAKWCF